MFTAEEARVMTQHAIDALPDRYYNVYQCKIEKAIQEAIDDGEYEALLWFSLDDPNMEKGLNRLIHALVKDYHYDITNKIMDMPWHHIRKALVKVKWEEKEENSGN